VLDLAGELRDGGAWANDYRPRYAEQIRQLGADVPDPEHRLLAVMREHLAVSLFERCVTTVDERLRCRLTEQRRMPAELAELVRAPVYQGQLRTASREPGATKPLVTSSFPTPVVFMDTSAQREPWDRPEGVAGFANELEAEWVRGVCRQWEQDLRATGDSGRTSISVLAFYPAQARLIRRKLGHPGYSGFTKLDIRVVDTVDRLQGERSDIVVISFCRTFGRPDDTADDAAEAAPQGFAFPPEEGYARWLEDINRLNVACTRARRSLVLIGHERTLRGLTGVPAAEAFYVNLFEQAEHGGVTVRDDWAPASPGGSR
jgi:superfamily I DNA and/or RNA helicase